MFYIIILLRPDILCLSSERLHGLHNDTDDFFIFLRQKYFDIFHESTGVFFLLLKDFDTFHEPLFEAFCCFSDSVQQSFLYMWKKIFDWFFILRFYVVCFYSSEFSSLKLFFIRIYFIRFIRGNFYIFNNIFRHFFSFWQRVYILLEILEDNSFYLF